VATAGHPAGRGAAGLGEDDLAQRMDDMLTGRGNWRDLLPASEHLCGSWAERTALRADALVAEWSGLRRSRRASKGIHVWGDFDLWRVQRSEWTYAGDRVILVYDDLFLVIVDYLLCTMVLVGRRR
jgi:hypothetical protein